MGGWEERRREEGDTEGLHLASEEGSENVVDVPFLLFVCTSRKQLLSNLLRTFRDPCSFSSEKSNPRWRTTITSRITFFRPHLKSRNRS